MKRTLIKARQCRALVAFGDTKGFNLYADRVSTSEQNFKNYCRGLTSLFLEFKKRTGYFVKLMGDGCMVVKEISPKVNGSVTSDFLKSLDSLQGEAKTLIKGTKDSSPEDFLIRAVAGTVLRLGWENDFDYFGRAVNKADRLKGIVRNVPFVGHESIRILLTDERAQADGISILPVDVQEEIPSGLNKNDVMNLGAYEFR